MPVDVANGATSKEHVRLSQIKDVPMQEPRSSIVGDEAQGCEVTNESSIDCVPTNGIEVIIRSAVRTANHRERMLPKRQPLHSWGQV